MFRLTLTLTLTALCLSGCISQQVAEIVDDIDADALEEPLAPPECRFDWPTIVRSASFIHDDWILAAGPDVTGVERLAAGRITPDGIVVEGWIDDLAGLPARFTRLDDGTYVHSSFDGDDASFVWFDLRDPLRPVPLRGVSVGGVGVAGEPRAPIVQGAAVAICVGDALWSSDGRDTPRLTAARLCEAERDGVTYGAGGSITWRHQRGNLVPTFQAMAPTTSGFQTDQDHGFNPSGNSQYGDIVRAHMGTHRAVVEVENRRRFWVVTLGADRDAGVPRLASTDFALDDDAVLGVGSRALWLAGEAHARGVDLTDPNRPTLMFELGLGAGEVAPRLLDTGAGHVAIRGRDGAARVVPRTGGAPLALLCR